VLPVKVLITGANGQLGRALVGSAPPAVSVHVATRAELDVADAGAAGRFLAALRPGVTINAAAYTAVDKAETDRDVAWSVNAQGPRALAEACRDCACRLVQVSTDFVFDGARPTPYPPDARTAPLNVYGETKAAGEAAVREVLGEQATILRTAWVYAAQGHNFLRTMLRLMNERRTVRVVADQVGTPTAAGPLAAALWRLALDRQLGGIYHWTDAGVASWYDFAIAICEEGLARGLLPSGVEVLPITTADYPTPARRPSYSVLDKASTSVALHLAPSHWRRSLRAVMDEVARA
jgi:dTDP-4-dehydrorhamnose reductase